MNDWHLRSAAFARGLRKWLARWPLWMGWIVAAFAVTMVLSGTSTQAMQESSAWLWIAVAAALALALLHALWQVMWAARRPGMRDDANVRQRSTWLREYWVAQAGALVMSGVFVLLAHTGGTTSPLHPLVYAFASFLLLLQGRARWAWIWLGMAVVLEIALPWVGLPASAPWRGWLNAGFVVFFAFGHRVILRAFLAELRQEHDRALADELEQVQQAARDYRIEGSSIQFNGQTRAPRSEIALQRAGALAVDEQVTFLLELLRRAHHLHTCALLAVLPTTDTSTPPLLRLRAVASHSLSQVVDLRQDVSLGLLSAALRPVKVLRLSGLDSRRAPPYYRVGVDVTDLCAVPLAAQGEVSAVLCVDRQGGQAFAPSEIEAFEQTAAQIARVIDQERAFLAVDRAKARQEQLSAASALLTAAWSMQDVAINTVTAFAQVADFALALVLEWQEELQSHRVALVHVHESCATSRDWLQVASRLHERTFPARGPGLVVSAVKNRLPVCPRGNLAQTGVVLFDDDWRLALARSALVLPLIHGDRVFGTVVLLHEVPAVYGDEEVAILRVLSNQVAVCWENGKMYAAVEAAATQDALTGLLNRRAFSHRLQESVELAARGSSTFCVILGDIDHFKRVNDTYGHPIGDLVLKRVASCLTRAARKVDAVARWGGEEFIILLPGTDAAGAALFAQRVRKEIEEELVMTEQGTLRVTMSLGVAHFGSDAATAEILVDRADQALYRCKERGRNCVTLAAELVH